MIAWFTGSLVIAALGLLWVIIQFGILGVMFVVGFIAILIAALIGLVVWIITSLVNAQADADSKYGAHF